MVQESQPGHQHPGQIGRQKSGEQEARFPVSSDKPSPQSPEQGRNRAPPEHRVAKGGDGTHRPGHAPGVIGDVVPHRPGHDGPLIPGRGKAVLRLKGGMVIVHMHLIAPPAGQGSVVARKQQHRQKGCVVNAEGNHQKKQAAPQKQAHCPPAQAGPLFWGTIPPGPPQPPEKQHRQPHSPVGRRPLGGNAQAGKGPTEEQGQKELSHGRGPHILLAETQHGVVHEQQKKHRIGVNGGNAGLCEVHKVQGKENSSPRCQPGLAEKPFDEVIEDGQHQHPKQGPHKPPAKGVHAKEQDAQAHDELPQGGVGVLIGFRPQQVLIGRAGVVDFVKIRGVVPGGVQRHFPLLVHQ